jgi:WD40 repeat protein
LDNTVGMPPLLMTFVSAHGQLYVTLGKDGKLTTTPLGGTAAAPAGGGGAGDLEIPRDARTLPDAVAEARKQARAAGLASDAVLLGQLLPDPTHKYQWTLMDMKSGQSYTVGPKAGTAAAGAPAANAPGDAAVKPGVARAGVQVSAGPARVVTLVWPAPRQPVHRKGREASGVADPWEQFSEYGVAISASSDLTRAYYANGIFDLRTGKPVGSLGPPASLATPRTWLCVAASADGKLVAGGVQEEATYLAGNQQSRYPRHTLALWDVSGETGGGGGPAAPRVLWSARYDTGRADDRTGSRIEAVAFSPDGKTLASLKGDGLLQLWDVAGGRALADLGRVADVSHERPSALTFSPNGALLAAAAATDGGVTIWDVAARRLKVTLKEHSILPSAVAFAPDGRRLAMVGTSGAAVFDVAEGAQGVTIKGAEGIATSLSFSPDGRILAIGVQSVGVVLWDVTGQRELSRLTDVRTPLYVRFGPDGKQLLAVEDKQAALWPLGRP